MSSASNNSGAGGAHYVTMSDSANSGDAHNAIVEEYYGTYGIDTIPDTVDYNEVKTIVTRTATMFVNNVGLNAGDINTIVNDEMADFWAMGIFRTDSTVNEDSFKVKLALSLNNGGVRTAWLSIINDNASNFDDHYNNARSTLIALTGLTQKEREINDHSLSILGSSYVLFTTNLTTKQKATIIADADALGFSKGWERAENSLAGMINPAFVLAYAHYFSAKCSILAARLVL